MNYAYWVLANNEDYFFHLKDFPVYNWNILTLNRQRFRFSPQQIRQLSFFDVHRIDIKLPILLNKNNNHFRLKNRRVRSHTALAFICYMYLSLRDDWPSSRNLADLHQAKAKVFLFSHWQVVILLLFWGFITTFFLFHK